MLEPGIDFFLCMSNSEFLQFLIKIFFAVAELMTTMTHLSKQLN